MTERHDQQNKADCHGRDDHSLDIPATLRHLDVMLKEGCHGLILLGTVGENCSLEPAEKLELLRAAVAHIADVVQHVVVVKRVPPHTRPSHLISNRSSTTVVNAWAPRVPTGLRRGALRS